MLIEVYVQSVSRRSTWWDKIREMDATVANGGGDYTYSVDERMLTHLLSFDRVIICEWELPRFLSAAKSVEGWREGTLRVRQITEAEI